MARQDSHPDTWFRTDGCTGVFDFDMRWACDIHDADYHWGGPDFSAKLKADRAFYDNMMTGGWFWRHGLARIRFLGVRKLIHSHPPGKGSLGYVELRGGWKKDPYNWLGPGRGKHAHMKPQGSKDALQLLPEQEQPA